MRKIITVTVLTAPVTNTLMVCDGPHFTDEENDT